MSLPAARLAHLRLRDLMLLEQVEELGSLTEVAARMHVTQSAITQALHSLEAAFGQALVLRGRRGQRGVRLTPAGWAALIHLRVARYELDAAAKAAADSGVLTLRIGALPFTLVQPLPGALARLRERLPQVEVQLGEDNVPNLWRRLESGEFEVIVTRLPALSEQPRLPGGVSYRTVGDESLVLACGRGHPIEHRRKPALAALRDYGWVLPPEGSYTRLLVEQAFLRAGLAGPRVAITSMSFHSNLRLVADGTLLAVAPRSAARAVRKAFGLTLFAMEWGREDPAIALAWRDASLGNPALVALLGCF